MYLAGVSVRRVENITEALWGSKVSPSTISELNKKRMSTLRIGGTVLCKVGGIRMSMWMGFIYAATGSENLKMWLFWSLLRSMRTDIVRLCVPLTV